MVEQFVQILETLGDQVALLLAVVLIASFVESALGIGAFLPGETVLFFAAVSLGTGPHLIAAIAVASAGAFMGDHFGYLLGRKFGGRMTTTRIVRRMGEARWYQAIDFVERHGSWIIIVARLLPGVRTLISAAAGALGMRYSQFSCATAIAAVLWSLIWVVGGATLGTAFLRFAASANVPTVAIAVGAIVGILAICKTRKAKEIS